MAILPDVFVIDPANAVSNFSVIPEGWYEAEIVKSELKTAKSGGKYLSLQFRIIDGEYEGKFVFVNLNLVNSNAATVQIAKRNLTCICLAVGIEGEIDNSEELHNIPMAVRVTITPGDGKWPDRNNIEEFRTLSEIPEELSVNPFA